MHIPNKFNQEDLEQLEAVIREHPFATLITNSDDGLNANHIPFVLDGPGVLIGHIARVNPLWRELEDGADVLLVFHGPECYVSPNYYPTKQEHGKAVPTWNYVVVHVRGKVSFIHEPVWNLAMLNKLTDQQESGAAVPWSVADAPEAYIEKMLSAIVGLQVDVSSITGQWKLSQNQPETNKQGVVEGLSQEPSENSRKIAELVGNLLD